MKGKENKRILDHSSMSISMERFLQILGPLAEQYTAVQLELLREQMCSYAEIIIDIILNTGLPNE